MCCVFTGHHGVLSHVKQNHDSFATDDQKTNLSIRSSQKTWSAFAEAFDAEARDFGITTLKLSLIAIINWHLNYQGAKCTSMQTELPANSIEGLDLDQDSLALVPELSIGQDLDQDPLVLVPDPPGHRTHLR